MQTKGPPAYCSLLRLLRMSFDVIKFPVFPSDTTSMTVFTFFGSLSLLFVQMLAQANALPQTSAKTFQTSLPGLHLSIPGQDWGIYKPSSITVLTELAAGGVYFQNTKDSTIHGMVHQKIQKASAKDLNASLATAVKQVQITKFTGSQTLGRTYGNFALDCDHIGDFFDEGETLAVQAFSEMLSSGTAPVNPASISPSGYTQAYVEMSECFTAKGIVNYDSALGQILISNTASASKSADPSSQSSIDAKRKIFTDFQSCISSRKSIAVNKSNNQCISQGALARLEESQKRRIVSMAAMGTLLNDGVKNVNNLMQQIMKTEPSDCSNQAVKQNITNTLLA